MNTTDRRVHTVHYPATDHMGEDFLQRIIAEELRPLIARWLRARRVRAFTGADQFIYWVPGDPTQRVAPDVYVLPKVDPDAVPSSWQLWEVGSAPSFALEIVSRDVQKDYDDAPALYNAMGAKELVIFDPGATARSRTRVRWQVYRRLARRGFVRVAQTMDDRVEVASLGGWLVAVGTGRAVRLRVGTGVGGGELFPTEPEEERAARDAAEAARDAAEAARDAAEAEIARLRALLASRG